MIINICLPVWGDLFRDQFLRFVLPSHLAKGNLPYLSDRCQVRYYIYSTRYDINLMMDHPAIAALAGMTEIVFMPIRVVPEATTPLNNDNSALLPKYGTMVECYCDMLGKVAGDPDQLICLWTGDILLTEDCCRHWLDYILAGKRAVLSHGISIISETAEWELRQYQDSSGTISVPPRDMVALMLKHLHPFSAAQCWNGDAVTKCLSMLYWKVENEGLISRAFHTGPMMARGCRKDGSPVRLRKTTTPDIHFVDDNYPDCEELVIQTDSDEGFVVEMCSIYYERQHPNPSQQWTVEYAVGILFSWYMSGFFPDLDLHLFMASHMVCYHQGKNGPAWEAMEAQSKTDFNTILDVTKQLMNERARMLQTLTEA
ncbi:MAG: hypothetical protein K2Q10_09350 [Rhodospirillales bacterium]|nr:hypothetical protein [Rhodospirillales bacterium]